MNAKQLLIVDDSPVIKRRLKSLLIDLPGLLPVREADSYAEAITQLSVLPSPDILLLDINLPDRSGIELLRYVRQHHPNIMVIMITNQGTTYYRDLCLQLGAVRYIDKSTEFELVPMIVTLLLSDGL